MQFVNIFQLFFCELSFLKFVFKKKKVIFVFIFVDFLRHDSCDKLEKKKKLARVGFEPKASRA